MGMSNPEVEWPKLEAATADQFLIELRRIADALETISGKRACDGVHPTTGQECVLGYDHVGFHVPLDGRAPWLDDV
jgi:hypothetical protein